MYVLISIDFILDAKNGTKIIIAKQKHIFLLMLFKEEMVGMDATVIKEWRLVIELKVVLFTM